MRRILESSSYLIKSAASSLTRPKISLAFIKGKGRKVE